MKGKNFIPHTPKERTLVIQDPLEKSQRLCKWEELLDKLPYLRCFKSRGELACSNGYVNDNIDLFNDACFVYQIPDLFPNHETAYLEVYLCFLENGKFEIITHDNLFMHSKETLSSPLDCYLNDLKSQERDSWEEGYYLSVEIISNIISHTIPAIPDVSERPKLLNINAAETEEALNKWVEHFLNLAYCQVLSYYDLHENDRVGNFALVIIYFSSPAVYRLSQNHDLFAGWRSYYNEVADEKDLHRVEIKFSEVYKLPRIYEKVKNELISAWGVQI